MAFNNFPYTDAHELNLDWIIKKQKGYIILWMKELSLQRFVPENDIRGCLLQNNILRVLCYPTCTHL